MYIPEGSLLAKWEQPPNVKYGSHEPYVLYVRENSSWWNVMSRYQHCSVGVVSHVHSEDMLYGHWTEYEFHNYHNEPDYFTRCVVNWEPEGVTIAEPSGHKLFIPKNSFIGGR